LNVKYVSSFQPLSGEGITLVHDFPEYPSWLYQVDRVVPRAYLVPRVVVETDRYKTLDRISAADFDPLKEVILEQPLPNVQEHPATANRSEAKIVDYGNQKVTIQASVNFAGILVLTDSFYPGWRAYVDGREAEIFRANLFFRAVALPKGDHLVEFHYSPLSFTIGLTVSLVTLCSLLVFMIKGVVFRKRVGDLSSKIDAKRKRGWRR
jgi:hypothetical protein